MTRKSRDPFRDRGHYSLKFHQSALFEAGRFALVGGIEPPSEKTLSLGVFLSNNLSAKGLLAKEIGGQIKRGLNKQKVTPF